MSGRGRLPLERPSTLSRGLRGRDALRGGAGARPTPAGRPERPRSASEVRARPQPAERAGPGARVHQLRALHQRRKLQSMRGRRHRRLRGALSTGRVEQVSTPPSMLPRQKLCPNTVPQHLLCTRVPRRITVDRGTVPGDGTDDEASCFCRPIAGNVNICPASLSERPHDQELLISTIKHEVAHALVFSDALFADFPQVGRPSNCGGAGLRHPKARCRIRCAASSGIGP